MARWPSTPTAVFVYTPASGFVGSDRFTYRASDGVLESNIATVTIDVSVTQNHAPVAVDQAVKTYQGYAINILLRGTDADGDPLTYIVLTKPQHGVVTNGAGGPAIVYVPSAGYTGPDALTFKVHDGTRDSNVATVSITVGPLSRLTVQYTGVKSYLKNLVWTPFPNTGVETRPDLYWFRFDGSQTGIQVPENTTVVKSVALVKVQNNAGTGIPHAVCDVLVNGGWRRLVATDARGTTLAVLDGLVGNTTFRLNWMGTTLVKTQNIAANSIVILRTP